MFSLSQPVALAKPQPRGHAGVCPSARQRTHLAFRFLRKRPSPPGLIDTRWIDAKM